MPSANPKRCGYAPISQLSPELRQSIAAQGSTPLENPSGIVGWYGYENDAPSPDNPALPQFVPATGSTTEAQKTEPDKNTYLVLKNQHGPTPTTTTARTSSTRVTRAASPGAHHADQPRRRQRAPRHAAGDAGHPGQPAPPIDGSTWDPWAQRLLFTTENPSAPTYAATLGVPSQVEDVSGALGRGGYEGIQDDSDGDIWIVEDIGGSNKPGTTAKRPNSFLYRYVPSRPGDLHNGRLQVLQVLNQAGAPVTFESQAAVNAPTRSRSHLRPELQHEVDHDPRHRRRRHRAVQREHARQGGPRDAVQAAGERPFRPGSKFGEFFFDETGDTNVTSAENGDPVTGAGGAAAGRRSSSSASAAAPPAPASCPSFYEGNESVAGLDNVAFLSRNLISFVEDAGDGLHGAAQRARLRVRLRRHEETTRAAPSRFAGSPRAVTRPRRWTPRTAASARTRATTRSPASTSPTATRARTASSARSRRASSRAEVALVLHPAARRQLHVGGDARRREPRRRRLARRLRRYDEGPAPAGPSLVCDAPARRRAREGRGNRDGREEHTTSSCRRTRGAPEGRGAARAQTRPPRAPHTVCEVGTQSISPTTNTTRITTTTRSEAFSERSRNGSPISSIETNSFVAGEIPVTRRVRRSWNRVTRSGLTTTRKPHVAAENPCDETSEIGSTTAKAT